VFDAQEWPVGHDRLIRANLRGSDIDLTSDDDAFLQALRSAQSVEIRLEGAAPIARQLTGFASLLAECVRAKDLHAQRKRN
jgi:hypothetical protein